MTFFKSKKRAAERVAERDAEREKSRMRGQSKRWKAINRIAGIDGAKSSTSGSWPGIQTSHGDDSLNREYLEDLETVQSRAQDLDVNQADLHGFHRTRTAKILGRGVSFRLEAHPGEVGLTADEMKGVSEKVDRVREIHSRQGGFDAQGFGRSEGKQMERAVLSMFVHGACLIHRVWRRDSRYALPLTLELIPAYRISTPFERQGDPKISYGIEYSDNLRTKVVGFHIRRVSMTVGDSFIPNFVWDFIPIADASLLSLTEVAGIDRALPISTSIIRLIRNRGEFVDSAVASARAQSAHYAVTECAEGQDPWQEAADDATDVDTIGSLPVGFTKFGDVNMLYTANGEKVTWAAAKLPDPNLKDFMDAIDSRLARGLCSSLSQFTRTVNNSWAGGRLEDQQDDPLVEQYREAFECAWNKVNAWSLEAIWMTGAVDLPGYSAKNAALWQQFRAQYYGKVHINPVDTMAAREKGYALRTMTPQQGCEQDGLDFRRNMRQWGEAMQTCRAIEKEFGLKEGALDFLLSGRAMTTSGGEVISPPSPEVSNPDPNIPDEPGRNRSAMLNRLEAAYVA